MYVAKPFQLEFRLDGLPKSPNQLLGAHWTIRSGHAKKWKRLVWRMCWHLKPSSPLKSALITFTRASSAKSMDDDNLAGSFKSVRDGLKEAGIIQDDSPEFVECKYERAKCAPKHGHVIVRVIETQTKQEMK